MFNSEYVRRIDNLYVEYRCKINKWWGSSVSIEYTYYSVYKPITGSAIV